MLRTLAECLNTIARFPAAYYGTGITPLGVTLHKVRRVTHHCDECGREVRDYCARHPHANVLSILA